MRALVLSGGGSKGAFQVGVLKRWMGDMGIDYDIMCGVSVGALNIAGLINTPLGRPKQAIDWLEDFWLSKVTGTSAIYKRWWPFGRFHALWKRSVYDSSPLMKLVRDNINIDKIIDNGRRIAIGAVCLDTGDHVFVTERDPNFVDWVLASSSFPVFLTPIEIDGKLYSDGGIINIIPIGQAIRMGADEIDVIMCNDPLVRSPWSTSRKVAVPDQMVRTLGLMSDQVARFDVAEVGIKDRLTMMTSRLHRKIRVNVVVPSTPIDVDALTFDPIDIRTLIKRGYDDANNVVTYDCGVND